MHDIETHKLVEIWKEYYNPEITSSTAKVLSNCPRIGQVDDFCLQKLKSKIAIAESKETDTLKKKKILKILKAKGLVTGEKKNT